MGMILETPRGPGKVVEVNIISESIGVVLEEGTVVRYPVSELTYEKPCPGGAKHSCDACPAHADPPEPPTPDSPNDGEETESAGDDVDTESAV
jgi:hypothetical protein